jgi:hypothetical protein
MIPFSRFVRRRRDLLIKFDDPPIPDLAGRPLLSFSSVRSKPAGAFQPD